MSGRMESPGLSVTADGICAWSREPLVIQGGQELPLAMDP